MATKKTTTKKTAAKKTVTKKTAAKKTAAKKTAAKKIAGKDLKVTLVKSTSGRLKKHRDCVRGLGLRRTNHSVVVKDTPENRGMINKVSYMLSVEEA